MGKKDSNSSTNGAFNNYSANYTNITGTVSYNDKKSGDKFQGRRESTTNVNSIAGSILASGPKAGAFLQTVRPKKNFLGRFARARKASLAARSSEPEVPELTE